MSRFDDAINMSDNTPNNTTDIDENWAGPSKEEFEGDEPAQGSFAADSLELLEGAKKPQDPTLAEVQDPTPVDYKEPTIDEDSDMAMLLAEETSQRLRSLPTPSETKESFLGFTLNNTEYMVPLYQLQKVMALPKIIRTPQNDPNIIGVTDIEGEIVPVIDAAKKLRLGEPRANFKSKFSALIICNLNGFTQAIQVDSITQTYQLETSNSQEPPEGIQGYCITSIYRSANKILLNLDLQKVLGTLTQKYDQNELRAA